MRLTLPQLEHAHPGALLSTLRGLTPPPNRTAGVEPADRHSSLAASIATSIRHLTPEQQEALTVLALLHSVVDEDVLAVFSQHGAAPEQFRGLGKEEWRSTLERAVELGLLDPIGASMYDIHPALPAYLASRWQDRHPDAYEQQRTQAADAVLAAHAALGDWLTAQLQGANVGTAVAILDWQRRNLGAQLGYALDHGRWADARAIADPLVRYWDLRGLTSESRGWVERVRALLEDPSGTAPELSTAKGSLWLFLVGADASQRAEAGLLDEAERTYLAILAAQLRQGAQTEDRFNIATTYHQLGVVAQGRGRLDEAEDWYRKALTIKEELGNRPGTATTYHQLGMIAQTRGQLDEAEDWYRKALTFSEDLQTPSYVAITHAQLGRLAAERGDTRLALIEAVRCVSLFDKIPHLFVR